MAKPKSEEQRIVHYLRDCYETDKRETTVFNLKDSRVQFLKWLPQADDCLTGVLDEVPLNIKYAEGVAKAAELYKAEKSLIFCSWMLLTRARSRVEFFGSRTRNILAPLVFTPARIEKHDDRYSLKPDFQQTRINHRMLDVLIGPEDSRRDRHDLWDSQMPIPPYQPADLDRIIRLVTETLPGFDRSAVINFKLHSARKMEALITKLTKSRKPFATCVPACAAALIPNSPSTRGVLNDLDELAKSTSFSAPIHALIGGKSECSKKRFKIPFLPASLSSAQEQIFESSSTHPLSLMVGPPGTGKSFTAATLALGNIIQEQSVLIVAQHDQALDVIQDKINELMGRELAVIRGGDIKYRRELKHYLNLVLRGGASPRLRSPNHRLGIVNNESRNLLKLEKEVRRLRKIERALEKRADQECRWGQAWLDTKGQGWTKRFSAGLSHWWSDWRLSGLNDYWTAMSDYQQARRECEEFSAKVTQMTLDLHLAEALKRHRKSIVKFSKAVSSRTITRQEEWFEQIDLELLLTVFPIWLVTLSDANHLLPFRREMFDLVILDEATQADVASCLPVLQRAKRAVVTGDPQQLRHLSFLSHARQKKLAQRWKLPLKRQEQFNYRDKSVLDIVHEQVTSQDQVVLLDEHFRSRPQIIRFSNREFYNERLRIMTSRPETERMKCVIVRPTKGRRDPKGINKVEARHLVAQLVQHVKAEKKIPNNLCQSIGVLSPFRDQVDHLFREISERLDARQIRKHRIRVGTPQTFQGEERDIMMLSFAVDAESHPGSFRHLERPDVFNVAITRARDWQFVFTSVNPEELPSRSLLKRYLRQSLDEQTMSISVPDDDFLSEVGNVLAKEGYHIWPSYFVSGISMDLLIERDGNTLGIDLVGYPGHYAPAFDLAKYRMFGRAGLRIFPLSFSAWKRNRAKCLTGIEEFLVPPNSTTNSLV